MTQQEKEKLIKQANEAREAKNWELFEKIMMEIPLSPRMALVGKEILGVEYMRKCNLALANDRFGEGWINV